MTPKKMAMEDNNIVFDVHRLRAASKLTLPLLSVVFCRVQLC